MKIAIALFALLAVSVSANASEGREFSLDVPAKDLRGLILQARVGEVVITGADTDTVKIRVRLEPDEDWFGRSDALEERLADAELEHAVSGDTLRVNLDYDRSGIGDDDLEEEWEITLPESLAVEMELNVGSAEIRDTSGGVDAEVNVGQLQIDVLRGRIDGRVNVGELDIRSATPTPGEFDLEVNIGEARLRIDGKSAGETSGWLGRSVSHDAGGEEDINGRVNVGEVSVSVER